MNSPTVLASIVGPWSLLAQTTSTGGSGGSISWELIIILVIVGIIAVALGWLLATSSSSD
jgi:hypothetical protein